MTEHPAFSSGGTVDPKQLAGRIRGMTSVAEVKSTRMIDISAVHTDPDVACEIANGVAQAYIQRNLDSKMTASMDAVKWLRREAEELKASLDQSELALQEYKEKTLSTSVVDEQNVVMSRLQDLSHALTLAQTERLQVETESTRIQALIASGGDLTQIDVIT